MAARMLDHAGYAGALSRHRRARRGRRGSGLRALPDPRRWAGARLHDETARSPAAASARRRRGPAASRRRCAPCPSCSRSPSGCASSPRPVRGSSTSRTRSGSSRGLCSTRGTARSASATSPSASSVRFAGLLGVEPAARRRRPGRAQPPDVGPRASVDGRDELPALLAEHGDGSPTRSSCRAQVLDELGAIPSYYLRYFYAHDAVLREQQDGIPRARRWPTSSASCCSSTATRRWSRSRRCSCSGAVPTTARPLWGSSRRWPRGDGAVHEVDMRNGGTLAGLADDDVVEVPARVGRRRAGAAAAGAARARAARARAARRRLRAADRRAAVSGDPVTARKALLAHPLIGQLELVDGAARAARAEPEVLR